MYTTRNCVIRDTSKKKHHLHEKKSDGLASIYCLQRCVKFDIYSDPCDSVRSARRNAKGRESKDNLE